ncbi:hypothetical protein [Rubidibacter lacunae]|uniref:hypothetical protein n=1 Tax=Rubidibacter lacunae TaxID=582514 RepID=UPI000410B671|nr:hypothetical protein [Rubidibacter lacunae]
MLTTDNAIYFEEYPFPIGHLSQHFLKFISGSGCSWQSRDRLESKLDLLFPGSRECCARAIAAKLW